MGTGVSIGPGMLWGSVSEVAELPRPLIDRLRHYFTTYKVLPGKPALVSIGEPYDREHAERVVQAAIDDYVEEFGD